MRIKYEHLAIIGFLVLNVACGSSRKMAEPDVDRQLGENEIREYNYALTEATKQKLFGNFKQAAALYKKCLEVNPRSDAAAFQLAGIYMMAQDFENAKSLTKKAASIDPDNYWYKVQLTQLYMISNEADSAIAVYEGILENQI